MQSGLYIGGQWVEAGATFDVKNKYSGKVMGAVSTARRQDVENAVLAALQAAPLMAEMPAHLRSDMAPLITQIDVQLDRRVSRLTRRVTHPGHHLPSARRNDAQRVQRKGQSGLVERVGRTLDQSHRRLHGSVHQARMKDIVSRRVLHDPRQPELRQYLAAAPMDRGNSSK